MELKVFKNNQFGEVRVIENNNEPWFVAKDVCSILDIKNTTQAIQRLDEDERSMLNIGRQGETNVVNESGLYTLILRSDKPQAKHFRKWVTSEVLPSIRKNGGYIANQENLTPEQIVANALVVAQRIIDDKTKQIETMKPKVEFFDAVASSKTAVSLGDVAKVLGIKGLGRNKLFELLRNKKILMKDNIPYQKYVDAGYFRVIEQKYTKDDEVKISFKTLVYQKGINYIRKLVS
ncbi:phage antirepressor [Mycoplasmatota bacterium]|nr:phage antirepressor [Mycoplasmatota bacterium]